MAASQGVSRNISRPFATLRRCCQNAFLPSFPNDFLADISSGSLLASLGSYLRSGSTSTRRLRRAMACTSRHWSSTPWHPISSFGQRAHPRLFPCEPRHRMRRRLAGRPQPPDDAQPARWHLPASAYYATADPVANPVADPGQRTVWVGRAGTGDHQILVQPVGSGYQVARSIASQ